MELQNLSTDFSNQQTKKMGMFSKIPYHIQIEILKKMEFKEFIGFKKCSRETLEMTKNFEHRLPLTVKRVYFGGSKVKVETLESMECESFQDEPVRFDTGELTVYSTHSNEYQVEDFVRKFAIKVEFLFFGVQRTDPEIINNLVKISKVKHLFINSLHTSFGLLRQPEIRIVEEITISNTKLEESYFPLLESPRISIYENHGLTLSAVNRFMKEWSEGKKTIEDLAIRPISGEHLEIFDGLEFSMERSPRNRIDGVEVLHICSMRREDGKKLFVSIDEINNRPGIMARESDDLISFVNFEYPWAEI